MNVGEAFLYDTKGGELEFAGKPGKVFGNIEADINAAAFGEAFYIPLERGGQAEIVEQRGMQEIGHGADALRELLCEGEIIFGVAGEFGRNSQGVGDHGLHVHAEGSEELASAVVEFASDAAAFVVLDEHQAAGEIAELLGAMLEFSGAMLDLFFESFREAAVVVFGGFKVGDVHSGGMKENNLALLIADGVKREINNSFRTVRPVVGKHVAKGGPAGSLGCGSANFCLDVR